MGRNVPEIPVDVSGNGERLSTLTFDIADAPILMHAMMIAGNVATMSSSKAEGRIRYYQRMFLEACPPGYQHMPREEDISDIAIAMVEAENWSIHRIRRYSSSTDGVTIITVDTRTWQTYNIEPEAHIELDACITAIAPVDCIRVKREDEIQHSW